MSGQDDEWSKAIQMAGWLAVIGVAAIVVSLGSFTLWLLVQIGGFINE